MGPSRPPDSQPPWWREHLAQLIIGLILATATPIAAIEAPRLLASTPQPADSEQVKQSPATQPGHTLVRLASVTSSWSPQPGQQHRSSGDFSTQQAPPGTTELLWRVSGGGSQTVSFDIMENKSLGFDPVLFDNLTDGSATSFHSSRSLYVANPRGATGQTFTVTVYAMIGS